MTSDSNTEVVADLDNRLLSVDESQREELTYKLLSSLSLSRLAKVQRWITPLVQIDIVGLLPDELALQVLKQLPYDVVLQCALVSRRWKSLVEDPAVWRALCHSRNWHWKDPSRASEPSILWHSLKEEEYCDDEGVGDELDEHLDTYTQPIEELDSGFFSLTLADRPLSIVRQGRPILASYPRQRHSAPSILAALNHSDLPDYKLLFRTHMLIRRRIKNSSYRLSTLQTRGMMGTHSSTIYCLQLHVLPGLGGRQVLFTGSKDKSVRQWNLTTGATERLYYGIHTGSILSLCAYTKFLVTGGSDALIVVWDIETGRPTRILRDHSDSVLCVRFDSHRLVSCSKDRTVRTYLLPEFSPDLVFSHHRAAVNAVALSPNQIVSASGDRSVRLWDAQTGDLIHTFENHHGRGIASIELVDNCVVSGSSDQHLRVHDLATNCGWSTSPPPDTRSSGPSLVCHACGSITDREQRVAHHHHTDLVRSVALRADFVVSGSYDTTIKVWDRHNGKLVADLMGGHTGRIFSVGFDGLKIVSCGEDQRICIWDFAHGLDTSFVKVQ